MFAIRKPFRWQQLFWICTAGAAIFPLTLLEKNHPTEATVPSRFAIIEDIANLELSENPASFIPAGLGRSQRPNKIAERGIIGDDNRVPMTNSTHPWSAIGRVIGMTASGNRFSQCTGTLIAVDIVLTNAHCIVDLNTRKFHRLIWFEPNLIDGKLQNQEDIAIVEGVIYGTDFQESDAPSPDDWAILKLNKPLGETYGTLGWRVVSLSDLETKSEELMLVGYSGDFPEDNPGETAGAHIGCSVLGELEEFLVHDCDTTGGASGGPILGKINDEFVIMGLHTGALPGEDGSTIVANYAVKMERLQEAIAKAREQQSSQNNPSE